MRNKLINLIEKEEGWRDTPYYCSENYPTVGYGFKIGNRNAPLPKFTLPKVAGDAWLISIVDDIESQLNHNEWYVLLNDARKAVIISMCYQIGLSGMMKFKNMIEAIEQNRYKNAVAEMLDSRWARQTNARAKRHSEQFSAGEWLTYYC